MIKTFKIFGHVALVVAAATGFAVVVMLLWNTLIPEIFGITSINFWQALGLLILCRLFFGGLGFGHHHFRNGRAKHFSHFHERWSKMTPEEQKAFIQNRHSHRFEHDFFDSPTPEKQE